LAEVNWDRCRGEFAWDGSLRDIYVRDVGVSEWNRFLTTLAVWPYRTEYFEGGERAPMPRDAGEIFARREHAAVRLVLTVRSIQLNCHFFTEDELELDLDPREVDGALAFDALLEFMHRLGVLLGRSVILSPENGPTHPIIEFRSEEIGFRYVEP